MPREKARYARLQRPGIFLEVLRDCRDELFLCLFSFAEIEIKVHVLLVLLDEGEHFFPRLGNAIDDGKKAAVLCSDGAVQRDEFARLVVDEIAACIHSHEHGTATDKGLVEVVELGRKEFLDVGEFGFLSAGPFDYR